MPVRPDARAGTGNRDEGRASAAPILACPALRRCGAGEPDGARSPSYQQEGARRGWAGGSGDATMRVCFIRPEPSRRPAVRKPKRVSGAPPAAADRRSGGDGSRRGGRLERFGDRRHPEGSGIQSLRSAARLQARNSWREGSSKRIGLPILAATPSGSSLDVREARERRWIGLGPERLGIEPRIFRRAQLVVDGPAPRLESIRGPQPRREV